MIIQYVLIARRVLGVMSDRGCSCVLECISVGCNNISDLRVFW